MSLKWKPSITSVWGVNEDIILKYSLRKLLFCLKILKNGENDQVLGGYSTIIPVLPNMYPNRPKTKFYAQNMVKLGQKTTFSKY